MEPEGALIIARPMEFPEVVSVAASPDEALLATLCLATTAVAVMLDERHKPPVPRSNPRDSATPNRLT